VNKKSIFIGLSPNVQKKDLILDLNLFFQPWRWQKGLAVKKLEKTFRQYFQVNQALSFISGRTALWAILQAMGLNQGDEILLQAYTCVVIPNTIIALGARPVWVDINPETFNLNTRDLEKKITPKTKAIIVQYTFGQPAKIKEIMKICEKHKLLLIEDCAQALGGEYQGQKLGTFADASFFSFGRDKIISSVFGGMAITNDKKLGNRLTQIQKQMPLPRQAWIAQQLFHPLAFSLIISVYNCFDLGKLIHFLMTRLGLLSRAVAQKEKHGQIITHLQARMPNALAVLALSQFQRLELFNQKRIKIANLYQKELKNLKIHLPKRKENNRHVFLRYTIKMNRPETLIKFARKRGIFLGDWYRPVIAPKGVDQNKVFYQTGSCPQAEKTAAMSVNLPTHPKMTIKDAKKVIKILKEFNDY